MHTEIESLKQKPIENWHAKQEGQAFERAGSSCRSTVPHGTSLESNINGSWSTDAYAYASFRAVFGLYLLIHFAALIPWGAELFSNQGCLPNSHDSPLAFLFPNALAIFDSPLSVTILLAVATILSAMLIVGYRDRQSALA